MCRINKILLIDDDQVFLKIAKFIFDKSFPNLKLEMAFSGEEGVSMIKKSNPDVVFVDLNMPVMNGWDFLDVISLNKTNSDYKVFILTSSIDPRDRQKAEGYPWLAGFIEKPLTPEKLREQLV